jgi:hypothetical protein
MNKGESGTPTYWWSEDNSEIYWIEITDREDIGANLHAPMTNKSGKDYWSYSFVNKASKGDIIFHYSKKETSIISYSIVGEDHSIDMDLKWAARGTYSKGIIPHRRPGWIREFSSHYELTNPLSLGKIKTKAEEIILQSDSKLENINKFKKKSLYFPFELKSKRPMRPMQGYLFKFPKFMVEIFPELAFGSKVKIPTRASDFDPNEGGISVKLI